MKISYILNDTPFIGENNTYFYFYKIVCNESNEYYYGVHSTRNLNDGYSGSGRNINKLYKTYDNPHLVFIKYILKFFNNGKEMYLYEKQIVNCNTLKDKKCLNISIGGIGTEKHKKDFLQMYYDDKTIHVPKNELNTFEEAGWIKGISPNDIKIYVHNDNKSLLISKKELNTYLLKGYKKGKHENDKSICVNNGLYEIKIKKEQIDSYLSNGWIKGRLIDISGEKNGSYNKVWIYKDGIQKYINKNELSNYVNLGWENKFKLPNKRCSGKIWINNNEYNLRIDKNEVNNYLSTNTWFLGRIGYKRTITENNSQKRTWMHNENESKRVLTKDINIFINKGYILGRLPLNSFNTNKANINKIWINKDNINKRIFLHELDEYILSGWVKGRLNHKKYERRNLGV